MQKLLRVGLLAGLSVCSSLLLACNDDEDQLAGDGGAPIDAGSSLDATVPSIDAGAHDAAADGGVSSKYTLVLSSREETPACSAAGTAASGAATVVVSADHSTIDVTISYSGLSGAATMGHIHGGAAGASGPVALPFGDVATQPIVRTLTAANYSAAAGLPATFAAFVDSLKAGNAYLNIHTAACPMGEIRAQIR